MKRVEVLFAETVREATIVQDEWPSLRGLKVITSNMSSRAVEGLRIHRVFETGLAHQGVRYRQVADTLHHSMCLTRGADLGFVYVPPSTMTLD